ncbi:hypothetical protein CI109_104445 [Kwoniella shandongensis]|uniref:Intradiol ring-cleavage dioxygenases domain-containing protein n=1 Tax=Kwoniella shandongensis TaxID=1734106 RepID=A0AAJ8LLJ3_9TREE
MPKLSDVAHLGKAVREALDRGAPDIELSTLPELLDLSADKITDNVLRINENTPDPRQKASIEFLTRTGQTCTDLRQEFILLSDVFGGATEGTVLGPFFVEDAKTIEYGDSIAQEGRGEYMLVKGRVVDLQGPVGQLLRSMNRHVFRPAHLHMMFQADGQEELVTSLYFKGDMFLTSDAVFGVKSSLVVDPKLITDKAEAKKWGFKHSPFYMVEKDFVLVSKDEADRERAKLANV